MAGKDAKAFLHSPRLDHAPCIEIGGGVCSWPHSRHTDRRLGVPWGHVEFVQKTRGKGDW